MPRQPLFARLSLPLALALCFTPACGKSPAPADDKPKTAPSQNGSASEKTTKKAPELAKLKTGAQAPEFVLTDLSGKSHKLSDYRGKTVVLEWFNPECPFVVHAHEKGSLTKLAGDSQKNNTDLVWLAINSGAAGKQGAKHSSNTTAAENWSLKHPILLDGDGQVGRSYGARTTPHMFIVDPEGKLVYQGAIDNAPFGKLKDPELNVYVRMGLEALANKRALDPSETKPYGCSVKYAS